MSLSTQQAILFGFISAGLIIGAGVYLGLRSNHNNASGAAPASLPALSAASSSASASSEPARTPAPIDAVTARTAVDRQVREQLEKHRALLRKTCWEPSVATQPGPATASFEWNFTFDAQGSQIARGLQAGREVRRADAVQCMSQKLPPIAVQPPGVSVYVVVPFQMP